MISHDYRTFDVFLSYSSIDKVKVRRLARRLEAAGIRVWFDEWMIKPGDDIYLSVERYLTGTSAYGLFCSCRSTGNLSCVNRVSG